MLCVLAKVDPLAKSHLLQLQEPIKKFGVPPRDLHGHITLVTYVGENEEAFISSCKTVLSGVKPFSVNYDKIEVLEATSILVASPRKEDEIVCVQKRITKGWEAWLDCWTQADVWKPHTTLLHDPQADLHGIARAIQEIFEPFSARINEVEFSRVNEHGYEVIESIVLR